MTFWRRISMIYWESY